MDHISFDSNYDKQIKLEWENFINNKPFTPGVLRPEIQSYWLECREKGIDPHFGENSEDLENASTIENIRFSEIMEENRLLLEIAKPMFETLYESIPSPNTQIVIFNRDLIPIAFLESSSDRPVFEVSKTLLGTCCDMGIGLMTDTILCQRTKKAAWCFGEENYSYPSKDVICSSAPIFSPEGDLLAIFTLSVNKKHANLHTLSVTVSTAKVIEEAIHIRIKNDEIKHMANQLIGAIESAPQGMIILNSDGYISNMNSCARRILYLDNKCAGKHISEVLNEKNNTFENDFLSPFNEQEMIIRTSRGSRRYFVTLKKFIPETSEGSEWSLVIIKEFDDVKNLSNVMTNSFSRYTFDSIIGESNAIRQTIKLAKIAAKSVSTVLITGPSGTGKELFAQAIHSASDRASGPFISVNCGALPAGLVESELFGYERGAFTGAKKEGQIGKFELANHGTIFLDEIGEMPLTVQASVLRVIQTKMITRIGGATTNSLDIRIIAATNKNLSKAIKNKEFREDLYYRLNVLRLEIPGLDKRKGDIRILTDYFLSSYSEQLQRSNITFSEEAYSLLENYSFPGNIRELENIIERVVNVCESDFVVDKDTLMFFLDTENLTEFQEEPVMEISRPAVSPVMMKDLEKDLIIETLTATNGSVTKTAEIIGIARRTLYRKFKEYDIDQTEYKKR